MPFPLFDVLDCRSRRSTVQHQYSGRIYIVVFCFHIRRSIAPLDQQRAGGNRVTIKDRQSWNLLRASPVSLIFYGEILLNIITCCM